MYKDCLMSAMGTAVSIGASLELPLTRGMARFVVVFWSAMCMDGEIRKDESDVS
jgi:hypothetical protein